MITYEIKDGSLVTVKYNGIEINCKWKAEYLEDCKQFHGFDVIEETTKLINFEVYYLKSKGIVENEIPDVLSNEDKEKIKEIFNITSKVKK